MKKLAAILAISASIFVGCASNTPQFNEDIILSNPIIQKKIKVINAKDLGEDIYECLVKAQSIKYVSDGETDYWQTPLETEKRGAGDCEDKAFYLQELLKKRGINIKVETGVYIGPSNSRVEDTKESKSLHAWNEYTDDKKVVYILDPASKIPEVYIASSDWYYCPLSTGLLDEIFSQPRKDYERRLKLEKSTTLK
ncbi:MAG: transglutaminase domain-containing protein [Nanoarchaeota archaeon]